ncbi:MAG: hypothetical protein PUP91_19350 [Rhizonema sp. PD37]|nr:hypothetical protein [Rhizonema sp. PD37]
MKTNLKDDHNLLLKWVIKGLKYFLLALVGFAIAYVISICFGRVDVGIKMLLFSANLILRLGTLLFCLIVVAIIIESLR